MRKILLALLIVVLAVSPAFAEWKTKVVRSTETNSGNEITIDVLFSGDVFSFEKSFILLDGSKEEIKVRLRQEVKRLKRVTALQKVIEKDYLNKELTESDLGIGSDLRIVR